MRWLVDAQVNHGAGQSGWWLSEGTGLYLVGNTCRLSLAAKVFLRGSALLSIKIRDSNQQTQGETSFPLQARCSSALFFTVLESHIKAKKQLFVVSYSPGCDSWQLKVASDQTNRPQPKNNFEFFTPTLHGMFVLLPPLLHDLLFLPISVLPFVSDWAE